MKQTAVEWLVNHWKKLQSEGEKMSWQQIIDITELAKEMEKEQMENVWHDSRIEDFGDDYIGKQTSFNDYFNETFNTEDK